MRRALIAATACVALVPALPASGALRPLRRNFGNRHVPILRAGRVSIPPGHASGRVRVIARLQLPPLAAAYPGRELSAASAARHLNVHSAASRAYLAKVATAQARAVAELHRALPQARVGRRFGVLLDGFTVSLPAPLLPKLARLGFVTRVYPSYSYTEDTNRSPAIIGADTLAKVTGANGAGIKIAIVDDGIDQTNPFFNPAGFSYPPGFPRGGLKWTTPKVIVARVFPGPNSGRRGRLAVDPSESFHGTHVAGIAAGDANTTAPAGADHPTTTGLSGVAPRAWLGNYRVFTVPTPIGNVANTPEIIAAFEAAVRDGMNVINFSGGGPQTDPANDALVEAVRNVVRAGVVPVIAAGNDGNDFGAGSVGSPGTAPAAISVAATSNTHVFAPALSVVAPGAPSTVQQIPFQGEAGQTAPGSWASSDQQLVDVGTIVGTDGKPVERHLCGPPSNLASTDGTLPPHSLDGAIALVQRGLCPFVTKAEQAQTAGAIGIVLIDNRQGEAEPVPIPLPLRGGMIANLDGARLISYLDTVGGRAAIRVGHIPLEIVTGRGGIITDFSSVGPTPFGHTLKPDVSAPGGQILSATLPSTDKSRFAVFDGTSMATPHVSGAAALLLQLHPTWSPQEVKSALVSTAGPAWGDTAQSTEAPVPLEGGGLVSLPAANDPQLFTDPVSLSFGDLDTTSGAASKGLLVRLTDAGDGAGTWTVQLAPQSATPQTSVDLPGSITLPPGGEADVPVVVHAGNQAPRGEDYGFITLTRGSTTRRVPYLFVVTRPALASVPATPLKGLQTGNTLSGVDRVDQYRYPSAPFGNQPDQLPMDETGAEHLYRLNIEKPVFNAGVSIWDSSPGSQIDPWMLGSPSEDQVQGYAGTPVNVNGLMYDYLFPVSAAGIEMPTQGSYYVSVDSGVDPFSHAPLGGKYTMRSWVNDLTPPVVKPLTTRVSAGRPTIIAQVLDAGSGVDPYSLTLAYGNTELGVSLFDQQSGLAVFSLAAPAPRLSAGHTKALLIASDYQETKNVNTAGDNPMPNTTYLPVKLTVVAGPTVSWLTPPAGSCVAGRERLTVAANSTRPLRIVRFYDGSTLIATDRHPTAGLASATWSTTHAKHGRHTLLARATDTTGRSATASRVVRVCHG